MEIICINKHCIYCRSLQHLSFWGVVHNRIEYKINFHLAHFSMSLNIYSWNMFSKCAVSLLWIFKMSVFHEFCCSSSSSSFVVAWMNEWIYQLPPWLEFTLWCILNCMQPHGEKSNGFRLVDQFGHSTGPPFPVHIPYSFSDIWPTVSARCRGFLPFYVQICHLVARVKCSKLSRLFYEKFL
jgi:hypothetical protein